jgi:hypothetical protein
MAGLLWIVTIWTSTTEINMKMFLAICLATLVASLGTIAAWMNKPDHGMLSRARLSLETRRFDQAIAQHEEHMRDQENPGERRMDSAA